MGRRAQRGLDHEVRRVMELYRQAGPQPPRIITDEFDVHEWIRTSYPEQTAAIRRKDVESVVMMYNPDVRDPNRAMLRLEVFVHMKDGSRWRLYPGAKAIFEPATRTAAITGPAVERAEVLGRRGQIEATVPLDQLGHRAAERWAPLPLLHTEIARLLESGFDPREVGSAVDVTNGESFAWWRHFSSYSSTNRQNIYRRPLPLPSADVHLQGDIMECWLLLLGRSSRRGSRDPDDIRDRLLWLVRFQDHPRMT